MITVSRLRENIFNIIDQVLSSGVPVFIKRKGRVLKISVEDKVDKLGSLKNLPKRKIITNDPDDLIHMDWSSEWKADRDIS